MIQFVCTCNFVSIKVHMKAKIFLEAVHRQWRCPAKREKGLSVSSLHKIINIDIPYL